MAPLRIEAGVLRRALPRARVVRTGMGNQRARRAAKAHREGLTRGNAVAVAGFCGSLDPELAPGDVIVASQVTGCGAPRACASAEVLLAALGGLGLRARLGEIISIDHVAGRKERGPLRATGAIAVDMESAWLADAARGVPFAVLRVVSDAPGRELFRLGLVRDGVRALRALRAAAPALELWAESTGIPRTREVS